MSSCVPRNCTSEPPTRSTYAPHAVGHTLDVLARDRRAVVARPVIDEHELPVRVRLRQHRVDALAHETRGVEERQHDRNADGMAHDDTAVMSGRSTARVGSAG